MSTVSAQHPARSLRSRLDADDGIATLEAAILAPVLLFATMALVQSAIYFMATTSVTNAAQIALETARTESSSASAGEGAATSYLSRQSMVTDPGVSVQRGPETVTVLATGQAPSLVPFVTLPPIERSIDGPLERVTAP